jgi:voltage-gated potassium channel
MFRYDVPRLVALKQLAIAVVVIAISTGVYFVLPLGPFGTTGTWTSVAIFTIGLVAISAAIERQVRRYRSGASSLIAVLASLYLAVLFFSAIYFGLAVHEPWTIASLQTKLDALYFALSITTTVGFGDIHAVSQVARGVVTVHMVFNIGFIGIAVSVIRASTSIDQPPHQR